MPCNPVVAGFAGKRDLFIGRAVLFTSGTGKKVMGAPSVALQSCTEEPHGTPQSEGASPALEPQKSEIFGVLWVAKQPSTIFGVQWTLPRP